MKNLIKNIKDGEHMGSFTTASGYDLAKKLAEENEAKTGNKTIVQRVRDSFDYYNGEIREFYSFDVIEILDGE